MARSSPLADFIDPACKMGLGISTVLYMPQDCVNYVLQLVGVALVNKNESGFTLPVLSCLTLLTASMGFYCYNGLCSECKY
jgi:hypothetical protein